MAQDYVITYVQLFILEIAALQPDETRGEDVYIAGNVYPCLPVCFWMGIRYLKPDCGD